MADQTFILSPFSGGVLLVLLSVLWIGLGAYFGNKAKSLDGFMLAGRNVGLALGVATTMATWITSNTTMLAPQFALQLGVWGMFAYCTASFGLFLFAPLAHRIQTLMPKGYTSGDFIRLRYGKAAWGFFLAISIFYGCTWLISMGMAGGILLQALTGIPYEVGMTVILAVCVAYTLLGGLYAVIGTDFIQSLIILTGLAVVGFGILASVDFSDTYAQVQTDSPMLLAVAMPAAVMAVFNNLLFGVGEIFHSNVWWSRVFAIRKGQGRKAYFLGGLFWLPIPIAAGFLALASGSLGLNVTSPDMVGPAVAAQVLGKAGAGIVFAVFFCSLASSIDSLLASTSDLITQDFYRKLFRPAAGEAELRRASAIIIVGLGLFAWLVCLPRVGTLATVLFFAGPMVGSTIWPIATGLMWKRASAQGALWGMAIGSAVGLFAYFTLGWYTASLIGAAVSMAVVLLFAWLKPDRYEWRRLREDTPS